MNIDQRKAEVRAAMRAQLAGLSACERADRSEAICTALERHLARLVPAGGILAAFWPLPGEPDLSPLLRDWIDGAGRGLALPRVIVSAGGGEPGGGVMEFRRVAAVPGDLVRSTPFGILEPDPARCPAVTSERIAAVLVPGLAFDSSGARLGRGGGFYDRYLAKLPAAVPRIGIAFDVQWCEESLPALPHDQRVDSITTDRRCVVAERARR